MDELLLMAASASIGVFLCGLLIHPLFLRHDRWMKKYGRRWYDPGESWSE